MKPRNGRTYIDNHRDSKGYPYQKRPEMFSVAQRKRETGRYDTSSADKVKKVPHKTRGWEKGYHHHSYLETHRQIHIQPIDHNHMGVEKQIKPAGASIVIKKIPKKGMTREEMMKKLKRMK
jgi:hypothetical protein